MPSESNKIIAKNTLMLYLRMLFTMGISLYTSRIILSTLGVQDYGIYNIVGGIVILFSFLNSAMTSATQRFLSFEIGKKDFVQLKKVFSISLTAHATIALIMLILSETIGLWFVNTQLNLPIARMDAVKWVYQFSIITFLINILQVPYNASIIANERMSFYAYISIIEVSLKLLLVFLLQYLAYDKLKLFVVLISIVPLIIINIYRIYCKNKIAFCQYKFIWDSKLYKQLMSFSGWSLFGSLANVAKTQVITIFLNIFYGVFVNAAVGVANQVSTALNSFVSNFQIAFNPQIVKLYATHQKENLLKLIFQTTKFSYYLLLFLSLPVLMNTELILKIWLKVVPNYAAIFCQLTIIYLLIETISAPLWMAVQATGKIKKYQIIVSSILLLNVPISFFLLKLGFYPYSVSIVNICISLIALWVRLFFLHFLIDLPVMLFFKEILLRIVFVTLLSIIVPFGIRFYICDSLQLLLTTISSLMSVGLMILWLGLNEPERRFIYSKVLKLYNRNKRSL